MSIEDICKQYGFTSLVLFGSGVKDMATAEDVDLCYTRPHPLSWEEYLNCLEKMRAFFLKEQIDLVYWSAIPSSLKKEIADNYRVLYSQEDAAIRHINIGEQMFWDEEKYYQHLFSKMKTDLAL